MFTAVLKRLATWRNSKGYTFKCGHQGKLKTTLTIFGASGDYVVPKDKVSDEPCPECFANAAIRCAWCGQPILVGDAITLGTPTAEFKVPDYAVVYKKDPLQLVGCLRWDCGDAIARSGFWVMPGKVKRVVSPLEMVMHGNPTGEPMIFEDLTNPRKAIPIPDDLQ